MEDNNKEIDKQLEAALGNPKYFIETEGKIPGERYCWFPTLGDSMTDDTDKSIPGSSLVLGRWLPVQAVQDIPLHQPVVLVITDNGKQYCLLKSPCEVKDHEDAALAEICLRSYNPASRCDDFWLPFWCIQFVFVVERVRRPDGSEYIPKQEIIMRKQKPRHR
jgi:hypothetical protein